MKFLTLTVKDGEDRKITSTMRKTDKLQDLMDLYYEMVPVFSPDEGTFLYLGKPVDGRKTPKDYKMSDTDELDFSYGIDPSNLVALTVHPHLAKDRRSGRLDGPLLRHGAHC
jgi:hypothetical protein